jgi:galactokinase
MSSSTPTFPPAPACPPAPPWKRPWAAVDRVALALAGQRAETEVVGMPCGIMDQMAVLLGRAGHALFLDTRSREAELVPFDPATRGLTLLVIDTRVKHALIGSPYAERRRACERAAAALGVTALRDVTLDDLEAARADGKLDDVTFRRARHVVTENDRVLDVVTALRAGEPAGIGPALAGSHTSLAARMTGGGFGGSALALAPLDAAAPVERAVTEAFAAAGFGPPVVFAVSIADGAQRVVARHPR